MMKARWCIATVSIMLWPAVYADTLRVAVASNFAGTARELAQLFEQQTGHALQIIPGSTGKHYAQIRNGAPFDVFIAADVRRPALLEEAGVSVAGSRFTYARGQLILWSPSPDKVDSEGKVLMRGDFNRLAIANPHLAPYGRAAREVLEANKLWDSLQSKIVSGENIAQAFQFVRSENADLGFVAGSQLIRKGKTIEGSWWRIPRSMYKPIEQQAIQLGGTSTAQAFMKFLESPQARAHIEANGYDLP